MKNIFCWLKITALCLSLCMVFSGCSKNSGMITIGAKTNIRIAVHQSADTLTSDALTQMEQFMQKYSGGKISLTITASPDPVKTVQEGQADVAISILEELAVYGSQLEMLSSPFFFMDGLHASMIMNSKDFHSLYEEYIMEKTGCFLLQSVFYRSDYLLSDTLPLTTADALEEQETLIYPQNPTLFEVLTHHGAVLGYLPQAEELPQNIVLQFSPQVLGDKYPLEGVTNAYLMSTPALTSSQWIMAGEKFWNSLSPELKNLFLTAISYYTAYCEEPRLEVENNLEYLYSQKGTSLYRVDGTEVRKSMQNFFKTNEQYKNRWDATMYSGVQIIIR